MKLLKEWYREGSRRLGRLKTPSQQHRTKEKNWTLNKLRTEIKKKLWNSTKKMSASNSEARRDDALSVGQSDKRTVGRG